jgi:3-oxoacyl-[acyl-carrier-protein] synthase II
MADRRVVVTGIGLACPLGIGVKNVWERLLAGQSAVRRIQAFDPSAFDCQVGGEVEPFKVADYVPKSYRKSTKVMARDIEIAVVAAYEAVKDAGLRTKCLVERGEAQAPVTPEPTRFGANIGAGLICADLQELSGAIYTARDPASGTFSMNRWGTEGMSNLTPLWLLKYLPNMLACHVTIVHDAQAPSNTITCADASSHLAIGEAQRTIQRGAADVCICGGAESKMNPMGLVRQSLLKRLATNSNDKPESACKPFDACRSGTVIAEGGGLLILEHAEHAAARQARAYAEVAGFGASTNPGDYTDPKAHGRAVQLCMQRAMADAGVKPDQVDLVVAFAPGTVAHDQGEALGIAAALGGGAARVPVVAIKGAVGQCGAGAGSIETAVAAMAIHTGQVPPTVNCSQPDPQCPVQVNRQVLQRDVKVAITVGYALGGGQYGALVLKKYQG